MPVFKDNLLTIVLLKYKWFADLRCNNKEIFVTISRYKITHDSRNRLYLFDLKVSACYEPMECDQSFTVFNQTAFSMKNCNYEKDYLNSSKYIYIMLKGFLCQIFLLKYFITLIKFIMVSPSLCRLFTNTLDGIAFHRQSRKHQTVTSQWAVAGAWTGPLLVNTRKMYIVR